MASLTIIDTDIIIDIGRGIPDVVNCFQFITLSVIMTIRQPRYSKEEFAQRGKAIYEAQVRSQVEEGNYGKIVAIDIDTGAFEVGDDSLTAAKQLLRRYPDAQIFGIRIGHLAVHRFGFHSPSMSV